MNDENTGKKIENEIKKSDNQSNIANIMGKLKSLEKDTLKAVSKYYGTVSNEYQEKKDIVNEFIVLSFNQLKSTVEANFNAIKEQMQSLHKAEATLLDNSQENMVEQLHEAKKEFHHQTINVIKEVNRLLESYKKARVESLELLVTLIKTDSKIKETLAFSSLQDVARTFSHLLIDELGKINEEINKNFDKITKPIVKTLADLQKSSKNSITTSISRLELATNEFKSKINDSLASLLASHNLLIEEKKTPVTRIVQEQSIEFQSLMKEVHESLELVQKLVKEAIGTENKSKIAPENTAIYKEFTKLKKKLFDIEENLKEKTNSIETNIDNRIGDFTKEFKNKMTILFSSTDFEESIDEYIEMHKTNLQKFNKTLNSLDELQEGALKGILTNVLSVNSKGFNKISDFVDQELDTKLSEFKSREEEAKEYISEMAGTLAKEEEIPNGKTIKVYEDLFGNLDTGIGEQLSIIDARYSSLFKTQFKDLFNKIEGIEKNMQEKFEKYIDKQSKSFDAQQIKQTELIKRFKLKMEGQLREFHERLNLDVRSLLDANQEIVGKIMVKSAETGSEFNVKAENSEEMTRRLMDDFFNNLSGTILSDDMEN